MSSQFSFDSQFNIRFHLQMSKTRKSFHIHFSRQQQLNIERRIESKRRSCHRGFQSICSLCAMRAFPIRLPTPCHWEDRILIIWICICTSVMNSQHWLGVELAIKIHKINSCNLNEVPIVLEKALEGFRNSGKLSTDSDGKTIKTFLSWCHERCSTKNSLWAIIELHDFHVSSHKSPGTSRASRREAVKKAENEAGKQWASLK